jgi:hypothetical protein
LRICIWTCWFFLIINHQCMVRSHLKTFLKRHNCFIRFLQDTRSVCNSHNH